MKRPTHIIRVDAPAWSRAGSRVQLLGPTGRALDDGVEWAFCLYPDHKVRPVPPEHVEARDG